MTEAQSQQRPWMRLDVQGLRAVAILLVVTYHSGLPLPGGFIGVDVFFVISGFVITELILRQHASSTGFHMRMFYARRMRRLLPALALMTTVVVVVAVFLESPFGPQRTTALTGMGASLFVANFVIYANTGGYFDAPAELNPLLHTWSLSVEEQFYFLFPALMILCWWMAARSGKSARAWALGLLIALSVLSFSVGAGLGFDWITVPGIDNGPSWAFYSSVTRAWEFAVGAILALILSRNGHRLSGRSGNILGSLGILAIAVGAITISGTTTFPGFAALMPVLGTAALIAAGTAQKTPGITRVLSTRGLVWIGTLSYSWYLWHWPVIVFTQQLAPDNQAIWVAAGIASFGPAWLAFRFVENPLRANASIRGGRAALVIAGSILIPVAASWALLTGAQRSWDSKDITSMTDQITPVPVSFMRGCDNGIPLGQQGNLECTWHPEATGRHVYLVGDSQAGQFAEAAIGATLQLQRSLTIATSGSCPFITTLPSEEPLSAPECEEFVNASIAWLREQPPATVVIGMSGNYVTEEFEQALRERFIRSIMLLQEHGHDIALLQAVPQFPEFAPFSCNVIDVLTDPQGCGVSVPRASMDDRQAPALRLFREAATTTDSVLIDTRPDLCPEDYCRTNDENLWIYRDPFHITVATSTELTGEMLRGLSR